MATNNITETLHVQGMYEDYFLDYASYVITDRAVPYLEDGLKPVQRRILHSLSELHDGRFHKAANVIGNTMKYHPHGDAAIRDALVKIAQKGLMIETQGNWGDPITGDAAAAPRYIECKLSKFAQHVAVNKKTTEWQRSYDGRNLEPVSLPVKFPLLLAQGAEGIAVGLATKILPHNFYELLDCCVKILRRQPFTLYPDFLTGGIVDVANYNDGRAGGKIKVRAKIDVGKRRKVLIIREVPFGTTTTSLMDSIVAANEKGKIKIKRIEDNTARDVEIVIYLSPGSDPQKTVDALYAFTDCEYGISPNCCIIRNKRPVFIGVSEMLKENVKDTVALLKAELEIRKTELEEKLHLRSLEKIFIEKRIYRKIETCETWEAIVKTIRAGLAPYSKKFVRKVTGEDIEHLTEIRIKRISKFDSKRADEELKVLEREIAETKKHLKNLTKYAIAYYQDLMAKYGKDRRRRTEIAEFEEISMAKVILSNLKVFYDRKTGFIGTGVRADTYVPDCSKLDDLIVFTEDGSMVVTKVADKAYVGKNIIHIQKFNKGNGHLVYNMIYRGGRSGPAYIKRFSVGGVTRDKQYSLTKNRDHSKVHHFSLSPRETSEKVLVKLAPRPRLKKKEFEVDLSGYDVKGRGSGGNIITKYAVRSARTVKGTETPPPETARKGAGKAPDPEAVPPTPEPKSKSKKPAPAGTRVKKKTAAGKPLYWNKRNHTMGFEVKGTEVCRMGADNQVLLLYDDGSYITYKGRDSLEVGEGIVYANKWDANRVFSAVYVDGNSYSLYGKRFKILSSTDQKYYYYTSDYEDSQLKFLTDQPDPMVEVIFSPLKGARNRPMSVFLNEDHFPLKKVSHAGERIATREIRKVTLSKKKQLPLL